MTQEQMFKKLMDELGNDLWLFDVNPKQTQEEVEAEFDFYCETSETYLDFVLDYKERINEAAKVIRWWKKCPYSDPIIQSYVARLGPVITQYTALRVAGKVWRKKKRGATGVALPSEKMVA